MFGKIFILEIKVFVSTLNLLQQDESDPTCNDQNGRYSVEVKSEKVDAVDDTNWKETTEKPKILLGSGSENNFCFEVELSEVKVIHFRDLLTFGSP